MRASELFDLLADELQQLNVLADWRILPHTASEPGDKQVDMTLRLARVGAQRHGQDWLSEQLVLRFSRALNAYASIGQAQRQLLDLRDDVTPAVLNALETNELLLFRDSVLPEWEEPSISTSAGTDAKPYLVLELRVPLERKIGGT